MEQLTEFNKIIDDLMNIDVNLEDEGKVLHLLCALSKSFEIFKDTMLYGKEDTITLDEVQSALRTKKLTKFKDLKVENSVDALNVSSGKGGGRSNRAKSKPKEDDKWRCFHYQKICHFKRDCPELKGNEDSVHVGDDSLDEGYDDAGALMVYERN
ncbi:cytochrome P450 [Trifolium medium]|uniref:Cytochrome P450 n=1 Tax=Trifolium medium TaxID=97028 RepID=A0A392M4P3_9FABA|nr:cytochrome P450 [Trifolium medium]